MHAVIAGTMTRVLFSQVIDTSELTSSSDANISGTGEQNRPTSTANTVGQLEAESIRLPSIKNMPQWLTDVLVSNVHSQVSKHHENSFAAAFLCQ